MNINPRIVNYLAAICAITFAVIGFIGNLWTILALIKNRKLRSSATTWFVISLCFSDLLFCTINLPLTATRYIYQAWIFPHILCEVFAFFFYANFGASLLNITLIAINRYVLISHFKVYQQIYRPVIIGVMITFVWLFSLSILLLPFLGIWGSLGLKSETFSCTILKKNGTSPKPLFFLTGILLPCVIIVFCYIKIYFKVRHSKVTLSCSSGSGKRKSAEIRMTRMMFTIFVTYIICFLPLMVLNVVDDEARRVPEYLHILASILAWASAFVNPIIYAVSNRQYRTAYGQVLNFCGTASSRMNYGVSSSGKTGHSEVQLRNRTTA